MEFHRSFFTLTFIGFASFKRSSFAKTTSLGGALLGTGVVVIGFSVKRHRKKVEGLVQFSRSRLLSVPKVYKCKRRRTGPASFFAELG